MTNTILYVSRGRGRGHAMQDLAIASELRAQVPLTRIIFASYDVGATVLQEAKVELHNLELSERNPFPETLLRIARMIAEIKPTLVLAHEELAALTAARLQQIPSMFLTHWFPQRRDPRSQALEHADAVLFLEGPGVFPEPAFVENKVEYLGPMVRPSTYTVDQRAELRQKLGLRVDEIFALVLPGSPREERSPIFNQVCRAFDQLSATVKRMTWIAGRDHTLLKSREDLTFCLEVIENTLDVQALMIASDFVVTKGTYNTLCELASLGIPSIALSHGKNFVDDVYAKGRPLNTFLYANETSVDELTRVMEHLVQQRKGAQGANEAFNVTTPETVAKRIISFMIASQSSDSDMSSFVAKKLDNLA
jgi:UDP-N-acetylglucosamine:LPS N-acetylglucosamine transferase